MNNITLNKNFTLFATLLILPIGILITATVIGPIPTMIVLMFALIIMGFVTITLKNELYGMFFMIYLYLVIPYSSTDPILRRTGEYYNLFSRFSMFISPWDYMMLLMIGIWGFKKYQIDDFKIRWIEFVEIKIYLILMIIGLFVGLIHVNGSFMSYGPTRFIQPIISFIPFYYFVIMYLLTINFVNSKENLNLSLRFIKSINYIILSYAIVKLILYFTGIINTISGFGIPLIVYDQAILIVFLVLLYSSFVLTRVRSRYKNFLLSFLMLIIVIGSTRRFIYLVQFLGLLTVIFYCYKSRMVNFAGVLKYGTKIIGFIGIAGVLVYLIIPDFVEAVGNSLKTLYTFADSDLLLGEKTRKAEIENIILNLNVNPYTYFFGYGLGTNWKTITPVPFDSFAFTQNVFETSQIWFTSFHLPYLSKLYRFGYLGVTVFVVLLWIFVKRCLLIIRSISKNQDHKIFAIAISSYLTILIFESGDTVNPTVFIFTGFLYGILTSLYRFNKESNSIN